MERIVKGIWVPIEIWEAEDLSWNEKILLMDVDSFTQKGKECYISNRYIADKLGVSERTASEYLTHLINAGYVRLVRFDGRCRFVESALPSLQGSIEANFKADWKNTSMQGGKKLQETNSIDDLNKRTDKEKTIKEKANPFLLYNALREAGVEERTALDWIHVRRAKRLASTETGWKETLAEIRKTGYSAEWCIRTAVAQGWGGFRADWLDRLLNGNGTGTARARKPKDGDAMMKMYEKLTRSSQPDPNDLPDLPDEQ